MLITRAGLDAPDSSLSHSLKASPFRLLAHLLRLPNTDLSITRNMDALNRVQYIYAQYFDVTNSPVAAYQYFGPGRIQTKILGNGAYMTNTFDLDSGTFSCRKQVSPRSLLKFRPCLFEG